MHPANHAPGDYKFCSQTPNKKKNKNSGTQGGTVIFSSYVGSGPASLFTPKNIRNFKHPQKIFEILATLKNLPHSVL